MLFGSSNSRKPLPMTKPTAEHASSTANHMDSSMPTYWCSYARTTARPSLQSSTQSRELESPAFTMVVEAGTAAIANNNKAARVTGEAR